MSGAGSSKKAILTRMRLYTIILVALAILGIAKAVPIILVILSFPILGFLFYRESCPKCQSALALQKGNGFIRLNANCRACGYEIK